MQNLKLVDIAQDHIKDLIINDKGNADGYLPSEGQLATDLSMSRVTIREAVRSLEVRGFVQRIHGKGIKIVDNSVGVLEQSLGDMIAKQENALEDLLVIRTLLEPYGASEAAKLRSIADLKQLNDYLFTLENAISMDEEYYNADLSFHIKLADIGGNKIFKTFVNAYTNVLKDLIVTSSQASTPIEQQFHYHRKIYDAIAKQDSDAAYKAMEEHLVAAGENMESYKCVN